MTQEQLEQIEAWRESLDEKQNDEHIVNAMWLAEEMWERHHAILQAADEITKFKVLFKSHELGDEITKFKILFKSHELGIDFNTYISYFCMTLMEYIWMPHDIIKAITADLDDLDTMPEMFICIHRERTNDYMVYMSYMGTTDEDHDYEKRSTLKICDTNTEAEALTAILNHANKSGHDAVTRLSA